MTRIKRTEEEAQRVKETHEVFTPKELGLSMLGMFGKNAVTKSCTTLDNSCGKGNLLKLVVKTKLDLCKTPEEAIEALKTVYGIDYMADNVEDCREAIWLTTVLKFPSVLNNTEYRNKARAIIKSRIQWGDSLTFNHSKWKEPINLTDEVSFKEPKPSWNTKYPMWEEKPEKCLF